MNNVKIRRIALSSLFIAGALFAEDAAPAAGKAADPKQEVTPDAPEISKQELHEMLGYLSALGVVSSLQLEEENLQELANGLHKALSGELDIMALGQAAVGAALAEAQARGEAVQADKEELPAFSEGSLEKMGAFLAMQSRFKQLGFGADEADAIRDGFIKGAAAKELDPAIEAKMPALDAYMQPRVEKAQAEMMAEQQKKQAAMMAEQQKASEAAMAEFKPTADEWSKKDNINVVLETTQGDLEIELYPGEAPLAVANFVGHIEKGYYNDLTFHRVIDGFMIQGGDPLGTGTGGESIWGKPFPDEFSDKLRFDTEGLLAMANSGPTTNGSQFFITTSKPNWLNDKHTIFGKVVDGYDNVVKIEKVETGAQDKPVEVQKIVKAYVKK